MVERYSRPEMARIWAEDNRLRIMLRVEGAFLEVLASEKSIPASELKAFKAAAHQGLHEDVVALEAKSGHEVIALLSAVSARIREAAPALDRFLHYGLTSSDILDTALALQLREAADLLLKDWEEVAGRLRTLARQHAGTWMVGRTHGVHAEPISFGVKLAGWHAEALRSMERLRRAREVAGFGKLSGAVGCFTQVGPGLELKALDKLDLKPEPVATQVVPRDRHADYFHALVLSAAAVERFALEIRHLQRTEVLEAEEPFGKGQKGSSAMPHKRNPILCENLCGLARLVRSYESAVVENIALWHERDISHSSVERVAFPDAAIALDFMLARFKTVLDGLQVYPERMRENLDRSLGLVFSQKVLLRLVDAGLSREEAYELVQRNAMKTWKTREPFRKALEGDAAVTKKLSQKELAACFDLDSYKGAVEDLLARGGVS
ncbi:MAG: adenylosuccinate lyase [Elusimicrobia bacterium]|nr:adenylosuccinate lyase [Elusimicrobiota bacterium]